jgi:hypothetical protein
VNEHKIDVRVSEDMFWEMFDRHPHDPDLQAKACEFAYYTLHAPIPKGRTQSGIRVYRDEGWHGSGYVMVHWDDAKQVSWCLDNGYTPHGFPDEELPLIWESDPERDRILAVKATLLEWMR